MQPPSCTHVAPTPVPAHPGEDPAVTRLGHDEDVALVAPVRDGQDCPAATKGNHDRDSLDELGPVDYLVVEFPAGASNFTGEMAAELVALVDAGTIRVIDVLILTKNEDGTVDAMELSDIDELGRAAGSRGRAGGAAGRGRRRAPRRLPWSRAAPPAC